MRTNIVLDDELVEEAFRHSDAKTKRELVDRALREFVDNHKRRDIRELRGNTKVLARYNGDPVLVEQGLHLVATFHPELTGDPRVHRYFLEKL